MFFVPLRGYSLGLAIGACVVLGVLLLFLLTQVPHRYRKPIIIGVTFLFGWFYFLEFMIPGDRATAPVRGILRSAEHKLRLAQTDLEAITVIKGQLTVQYVEGGRTVKRLIPKDELKNLELDKGEVKVVHEDKDRPRLGEHDGVRRVMRAREIMAAAVADLRRAKSEIERLRPQVQRQLDQESKKAEAEAKRYKLTKEMLARDEQGNILNQRTKALRKRIDDLKDAAQKKIDPTIATIESARSELGNLSTADVESIRSVAAAKVEDVSLARSTLSDNFLTPYKETASNINAVIGSFAIGLGVFGLMSLHGKTIRRRRRGWINSLAFYVALFAMALVGFLQKYLQQKSGGQILSDALYSGILFNGAYISLQATMFSLVAFYIVSAAYRAFRVKSREAVLMMGAALLVMLGLVPIGQWMTSGITHVGWLGSFRLERVQDWIMTVPNMAAQRGMAFGIGVGGLAMALRIWLSLERGAYFDKQL